MWSIEDNDEGGNRKNGKRFNITKKKDILGARKTEELQLYFSSTEVGSYSSKLVGRVTLHTSTLPPDHYKLEKEIPPIEVLLLAKTSSAHQ